MSDTPHKHDIWRSQCRHCGQWAQSIVDDLEAANEALVKELHDASQVSPTEREGIECHIRSMLSDSEQEAMGLPGRQLHMQVLRVLSAYRSANEDRDQLRSQLEASQAECNRLYEHATIVTEAARELEIDRSRLEGECERLREVLELVNPSNLWDKARMYYTGDRHSLLLEWHRKLCAQYDAAMQPASGSTSS